MSLLFWVFLHGGMPTGKTNFCFESFKVLVCDFHGEDNVIVENLCRYLKRTYSLAKFHVKPDVIVFMGDLFDEGSTASADEYQRYYTRFSSIFDIPGKAEASGIVRKIFENCIMLL